MSDKRTYDEYSVRRELEDYGCKLNKRDATAFNSGSETLDHYIAKCVTTFVLRDKGYRVDTEVEFPNDKVLDVLGYAYDNMIIGVELETNLTDEIQEQKLDQYYRGSPLNELFFIDVSNLPNDIYSIKAVIENEL